MIRGCSRESLNDLLDCLLRERSGDLLVPRDRAGRPGRCGCHLDGLLGRFDGRVLLVSSGDLLGELLLDRQVLGYHASSAEVLLDVVLEAKAPALQLCLACTRAALPLPAWNFYVPICLERHLGQRGLGAS